MLEKPLIISDLTMFSKNTPEKIDQTQDINSETMNLDLEFNSSEESSPVTMEEIKTETTVKVVEKISGILSPYFIVIVGLYLYDDNFLFGSILIFVGVFSLLKFSYQDVLEWIEKIKSVLGQKNKSF